MDVQERAFKDIHFQQFNHNVDEEYWKFMEDPIYDISREGSVDVEFIGQSNIE